MRAGRSEAPRYSRRIDASSAGVRIGTPDMETASSVHGAQTSAGASMIPPWWIEWRPVSLPAGQPRCSSAMGPWNFGRSAAGVDNVFCPHYRWDAQPTEGDTPLAADPADVLIVGAGASGGVVALRLAQAGFRVTCLEQGEWHDRTEYRGPEL